MKLFRKDRQRGRRGVSAVEAAIVLPVVVMFLFGILEYSRYVMMLQVLTNAAREGARYAQIHTQPVTVDGVTSNNTTNDVKNVVDRALAGNQLSGQNVAIFAADAQGTNLGTWTNTQAGQSVCVEITGNYPVITPQLLFMPTSIPVTARAVMRSESN